MPDGEDWSDVMTTCPKCGASGSEVPHTCKQFDCGSVLWSDGRFKQGTFCAGSCDGRRQGHLEACEMVRVFAPGIADRMRRRLARLRRSK